MAKSEARQKALEIWLDSVGKMPLKDIAAILGVPPIKVRKWKSLDKWHVPSDEVEQVERATSEGKVLERNLKRRVPPELKKTKGPPYGSKNALGNKGGKGGPVGNRFAVGHGPPKGNRNAETTGEYTKIYEDLLTEKEREIYEGVDTAPLEQIDETIRILTIRERRMLVCLQELKKQRGKSGRDADLVEDSLYITKMKGEAVVGKEITSERRLVDKIIAVEEALTRVQEKKIRAIETKHRLMKDLGLLNEGGTEDDVVVVKIPAKKPKI